MAIIENTSKQQTLQQKRAAFALEEISKIAAKTSGKIPSDLASFIVGMPTMILTNGIGQTFAFLLSKEKAKHEITYNIMKKWIIQKNPHIFSQEELDNIHFLEKFNSISQHQYLEIQHEELRLLEWLKRYARAFEDKTSDK